MTKKYLILLTGILIIGVSNCSDEPNCCVNIDTDVQIHYQNTAGENLINSTDDFEKSSIKVYYKNVDDYEYIYQSNLDYPNMHRVSEDGNGNLILTIFPSNYYEGNQSTTLIELNESIVDTLVCEFELTENREVCTQAWLNDVEMDNRFIEVSK